MEEQKAKKKKKKKSQMRMWCNIIISCSFHRGWIHNMLHFYKSKVIFSSIFHAHKHVLAINLI